MKTILFTNDFYAYSNEQREAFRRNYAECLGIDEDEVTDEDLQAFVYTDENDCIDDVFATIENAGDAFIIRGTFSSRYPELYGPARGYGYKYVENIHECIMRAGDYITMYVEDGKLFCDYSHHDGGGTMQIKAVTKRGVRLYDNWNYSYENTRSEYDVLQTIFNTNFFSRSIKL